jgi:hypothetical protein
MTVTKIIFAVYLVFIAAVLIGAFWLGALER